MSNGIKLLSCFSKCSFNPVAYPRLLNNIRTVQCSFCQFKAISTFTSNPSFMLFKRNNKTGIVSTNTRTLLVQKYFFDKALKKLWPKQTDDTNNLLTKKPTSFNESMKQKLYKFGYILPEKYSNTELNDAAKVLLNGIYMQVPHKTIREVAGLEDSFIMWLKVVYLHIWLVSCQLYKGGRDGEILVSNISLLLWEDVQERLNHFQDELQQNLEPKKVLRESYNEMVKFFVLLDEGILLGDAILASSLWTLLYSNNSYDAEIWHIENLVHYLRVMSARLQDVNFEFFVLRHNELDWKFPQQILDMIKEDEEKYK